MESTGGKSKFRITTAILSSVVTSNHDCDPTYEVQVLYYSGDVPQNPAEMIRLRRSELLQGRAEEWQHSNKVTLLQLVKERHQHAIRSMRKDFRRREQRLKAKLETERVRFSRLAQMMVDGKPARSRAPS
jgi:hypothetical protein